MCLAGSPELDSIEATNWRVLLETRDSRKSSVAKTRYANTQSAATMVECAQGQSTALALRRRPTVRASDQEDHRPPRQHGVYTVLECWGWGALQSAGRVVRVQGYRAKMIRPKLENWIRPRRTLVSWGPGCSLPPTAWGAGEIMRCARRQPISFEDDFSSDDS